MGGRRRREDGLCVFSVPGGGDGKEVGVYVCDVVLADAAVGLAGADFFIGDAADKEAAHVGLGHVEAFGKGGLAGPDEGARLRVLMGKFHGFQLEGDFLEFREYVFR